MRFGCPLCASLRSGCLAFRRDCRGAAYEGELIDTWAGMFPPWVFVLLMVSLLVSALSTLDSALASAARLVVEELKLVPRSLSGGRVVMVVFMGLGGGFDPVGQ